MSIFTARTLFPLLTTLTAVGGSTYYQQQNTKFNHDEAEARFDELEGTLRGHIGLIEDALDRLEGKKKAGDPSKMDEQYTKRTRDEKKEKK